VEQRLSLSIVILAAGQGTRMRSALPKVLQTLAGRPMLAHVIDCAMELGADDVCVVYGYGGDRVRAAFPDETLRWALQAQQKGTGHAVMQALSDPPEGNRVLVLYGDVPLLQRETLEALLAVPADDVALLTVDVQSPSGYGRVIREGGEVRRIVEQKDATPGEQAVREVNTGVMLVPGRRLSDWLSRLRNDNSQGEFYLTDIIAMAVADGVRVHGISAPDEEEVMGINDRKQQAEAERVLQRRRVEALMEQGVGFADPARVDIRGTLKCGRDVFIDVNAVFEGDVELGDNVRIESNNLVRASKLGAGTVVHSNCHIEGATTSANCEIGPFSRLRPGAALAAGVKIGNFVEVKKSDIGEGSKVNHLTYIGDTTIGSRVNVGAGTITCNYDGVNKHHTVIGDGAFIGSGVMLVAPVEVGSDATVGAGSTITKAVPAGELALERSKQIVVPGWKGPKKKDH
jgi:bifunctional UDP-N-acetylglucosamine pyrophosphorylase/glucosamine-1-phosphate N-acetyltransferase